MDINGRQQEQFLRLFLESEDSLKAFLRSLLFNQEEVREVMQNVAAVLWRKFDPEMEDEAFLRWSFGVARMEVLTFRRDRARDRHVFDDRVYELLEETTRNHHDELASERRALDRCLEKLPQEKRELVCAAYAPGARIDRLAETMGRTAMALYKELHRLRLALLECTRKEMASQDLS
jgi:RNA polymerase sigma-70 factor (ECF subfamily)